MKRDRKGSQREPEGRQKGAQGHDKGSQTEPMGAKRRPECIQGSIFAVHFETNFQQKSRSKINAKIDVEKTYFVLHTCTFYQGKTYKCEKHQQKKHEKKHHILKNMKSTLPLIIRILSHF